MIALVSGGCKNGKSYYAQHLAKELAGEGRLYYIATMIPHDEEDLARIRRHIGEREGWGFETIEQGKNIRELIAGGTAGAGEARQIDLSGTFLFDSVTAVMENEMYPVALKERPEGAGGTGGGQEIVFLGEDPEAPARVTGDCIAFASAVREAGGSVVFVSDGIYGDGGEYSQSTESYRAALAGADRAIAAADDRVIEISYGIAEEWK